MSVVCEVPRTTSTKGKLGSCNMTLRHEPLKPEASVMASLAWGVKCRNSGPIFV